MLVARCVLLGRGHCCTETVHSTPPLHWLWLSWCRWWTLSQRPLSVGRAQPSSHARTPRHVFVRALCSAPSCAAVLWLHGCSKHHSSLLSLACVWESTRNSTPRKVHAAPTRRLVAIAVLAVCCCLDVCDGLLHADGRLERETGRWGLSSAPRNDVRPHARSWFVRACARV